MKSMFGSPSLLAQGFRWAGAAAMAAILNCLPAPAAASKVVVAISSPTLSGLIARTKRTNVRFDLNLQIHASASRDGSDLSLATASWNDRYKPELPQGVDQFSRYRYWFFRPLIPSSKDLEHIVESVKVVGGNAGAYFSVGPYIGLDTAATATGPQDMVFVLAHKQSRRELQLLHIFRFVGHPESQDPDALTFNLLDWSEWAKYRIWSASDRKYDCIIPSVPGNLIRYLVTDYLVQHSSISFTFFPSLPKPADLLEAWRKDKELDEEKKKASQELLGLPGQFKALKESVVTRTELADVLRQLAQQTFVTTKVKFTLVILPGRGNPVGAELILSGSPQLSPHRFTVEADRREYQLECEPGDWSFKVGETTLDTIRVSRDMKKVWEFTIHRD